MRKSKIANVRCSDPEHSTDDESDRPSSPSPLALRNLDITIEPGEKVAICGRSGR